MTANLTHDIVLAFLSQMYTLVQQTAGTSFALMVTKPWTSHTEKYQWPQGYQ